MTTNHTRGIGRRFEVSVTQTEIDTAIPANLGHCMIAEAVKRCFREKYKRDPDSVSVDVQTIQVCDRKTGQRLVFLTPKIAQRALLKFDQGIKPTKFSFRIEPCQVFEIKDRRGPRPQKVGAKAPLPALLSVSHRKFGLRAAGKAE